MQERVQKVMADRGLCSRRAAEKLIERGLVKVNGHPVKLGDKMDSKKDFLLVAGETLRPQKKKALVYYMLHKPRGYVTTVKDEQGRRTVMELLEGVKERVYPVGRLDKDTEGLLLLTNDGALTNMITHPSHGVQKLYRVTLTPHATEQQLADLAGGVTLDDGQQTLPAGVRVVSDAPDRTVVEIAIREGKNRQVRRMCDAVGLGVKRLKRISVGPVRLGMLKPGDYRQLTPAEVNALKASAAKAAKASQGGGKA